MVSKHGNFQHCGGRVHQLQQQRPGNIRASIAPYRKPFKSTVMANEMSFTASCQMPSDPLYIDFNNPSPLAPPQPQHRKNNSAGGFIGKDESVHMKKNINNIRIKGKHQRGKLQHGINGANGCINGGGASGGGGGIWHKNRNIHAHPPDNRFNGGGGGMLRGVGGGGSLGFNHPPQMLAGPPNRGGGRHMMPPMGPMGLRGGPHPPIGFQPPLPPPMRGGHVPPLPMGLHQPPMPPPPHFMRRNGRPGPMTPLPPPPMPPMMGPRMPPRGIPPHIAFNAAAAAGNIGGIGVVGGGGGGNFMNMHNGHGHNSGGKIKKPNPNLVKQAVKGKSTIKTLKNLVNQYPIDKPWVTDELRAAHAKKVDIENRLKGNKDDELFAQFKVQRDKFVAMYESARELYLKQEAATVMAKDAKDKQTNSNKNATTKAGNSKDAILNKNTNINTNKNKNEIKINNTEPSSKAAGQQQPPNKKEQQLENNNKTNTNINNNNSKA